jgi:hypothetical protein
MAKDIKKQPKNPINMEILIVTSNEDKNKSEIALPTDKTS